jgi:uncharacterized protein YndB with AHSA1/START domain
MSLQQEPIARAHVLIRKPVDVVFEAFIDPTMTSKFWFTRGSGILIEGSAVTWHWDMYGATAQVAVKAVEHNRRILVEWASPVEWRFEPRGNNATFLTVTASGFAGTDDEKVAHAIDSMGGFSFLLADCKAFLEHGLILNLVADHSPDAQVK